MKAVQAEARLKDILYCYIVKHEKRKWNKNRESENDKGSACITGPAEYITKGLLTMVKMGR